jgi:hypothetical protein
LSWLPSPSSHVLRLSSAEAKVRRAPQSVAEWRTGFAPRTRRCTSGTGLSGVCHLFAFRSSEEQLLAFR